VFSPDQSILPGLISLSIESLEEEGINRCPLYRDHPRLKGFLSSDFTNEQTAHGTTATASRGCSWIPPRKYDSELIATRRATTPSFGMWGKYHESVYNKKPVYEKETCGGAVFANCMDAKHGQTFPVLLTWTTSPSKLMGSHRAAGAVASLENSRTKMPRGSCSFVARTSHATTPILTRGVPGGCKCCPRTWMCQTRHRNDRTDVGRRCMHLRCRILPCGLVHNPMGQLRWCRWSNSMFLNI
jgi:hypothetical protein